MPTITRQNIISSGLCIGCGSCVAQDGFKMKFDRYGQYKPSAPAAWLHSSSEQFARTCPFSPVAKNEDELAADHFLDPQVHDPLLGRFQAAYVGHVAEENFRASGSSGGMVSWVASELLRQGLVDGVAHVKAELKPEAEGHLFAYQISRTEEEVRAG